MHMCMCVCTCTLLGEGPSLTLALTLTFPRLSSPLTHHPRAGARKDPEDSDGLRQHRRGESRVSEAELIYMHTHMCIHMHPPTCACTHTCMHTCMQVIGVSEAELIVSKFKGQEETHSLLARLHRQVSRAVSRAVSQGRRVSTGQELTFARRQAPSPSRG